MLDVVWEDKGNQESCLESECIKNILLGIFFLLPLYLFPFQFPFIYFLLVSLFLIVIVFFDYCLLMQYHLRRHGAARR